MKHDFGGEPIPVSLFEAMKEEYKQSRLALIKENLGIEDASKTWYSKKTIDALFKAAGATEENSDGFGLEIHYGVVPKDRLGVNIPDSFVGLHNVILTATNKDKPENDDSDPYDVGGICPPNC